jgi:hypothetical protein
MPTEINIPVGTVSNSQNDLEIGEPVLELKEEVEKEVEKEEPTIKPRLVIKGTKRMILPKNK